MSLIQAVRPRAAAQVPEPPIARFLFADPRMAWFWLIVRVYVAYEWLTAGLEKLTGTNFAIGAGFGTHDPKTQWVFTPTTGAAIKGFVKGALAQTSTAHPNVQGWYAGFLQTFVLPHPAFWAYAITFGEVAVGLGLLVGALTGIAAFFGLFMNLNYLLAGTVSTNPILGVAALFLVLAWRVAGYYGVDAYLLPLLGTPWTGKLAGKSDAEIAESVGRRHAVVA
ncbi:MAG TPA: DoxX family membrane protein [Ktedonobacterales bacterium]|nr:DoxX family membrane protein [Ktedonobacterales bacterium]